MIPSEAVPIPGMVPGMVNTLLRDLGTVYICPALSLILSNSLSENMSLLIGAQWSDVVVPRRKEALLHPRKAQNLLDQI